MKNLKTKIKFRIFDIVISLLVLTLLSPLIVIISLILLLINGRPILFKQKRIGINNITFNIYKFRTLINEQKNPDDLIIYNKTSEITFLGKYLRRFKIDEIPQFVNVIKKEMSIVGPRPLTLKKYNELQKSFNLEKRHSVLPGITGLAQINGERSISWAQRIKLDLHFVDNYNLKSYLTIIYKTLSLILKNFFIKEKNINAKV